jgi:hypothetical protein
VLRDENPTVLPFRDAALRRPIDVVAWMNLGSPPAAERPESHENVVSLELFARAGRRNGRARWLGDSPGGEAA